MVIDKEKSQIDREIEAAKEINTRLKKKKELAEIELENRRLRKEIIEIESNDWSWYTYSYWYNPQHTDIIYCNTNCNTNWK